MDLQSHIGNQKYLGLLAIKVTSFLGLPILGKSKIIINGVVRHEILKSGDTVIFEISSGSTTIQGRNQFFFLTSSTNIISIDVAAGATYKLDYKPNIFNTGFVLESKDGGICVSKPNYISWIITGAVILMLVLKISLSLYKEFK